MSADAYHITATHPEGLGAILAMRSALEDAGMTTADIDYINVHGTSTPVGDVSEVKAIIELFGEDAYKLNISSTKSMTGHLLGATGALEAMFSVKAVQEDVVPPTINHDPEDHGTLRLITTSISHLTAHRTVRYVPHCQTHLASAATTLPLS